MSHPQVCDSRGQSGQDSCAHSRDLLHGHRGPGEGKGVQSEPKGANTLSIWPSEVHHGVAVAGPPHETVAADTCGRNMA